MDPYSGPPVPWPPFERSPDDKVRDRERTLAWLNEKWPEPRSCPVCRTDSWAIGDIVEVPIYIGQPIVGGHQYLFVPVTCMTCTHTYFFNALQMGVVEP